MNFEITVDHCNLIGFQQLDLFMNQTILLQRYIASFLFKNEKIKQPFYFSFQQTGYETNNILVLTKLCDFKMAVIEVVIELCVVQKCTLVRF